MKCADFIPDLSGCYQPQPTQEEILADIKRLHGHSNYHKAKNKCEYYNNFNLVLTGFQSEKVNDEVIIKHVLTKLLFADKYGPREFEYKF